VIAQVQLGLPSDVVILAEEQLEILAYKSDEIPEGLRDVQVNLLPPYRSRRPSGEAPGVPGADPDDFSPADPQPVDPAYKIDGKPAVPCDAIAVNIVAPDFDRPETSAELTKQLVGLACKAVNAALQRLRVMARITHLKPLDPAGVAYRLVFLDDDGELVPEEDGKYRHASNWSVRIEVTAITPATWQRLAALGEYETPAWDELLLDAMHPDVELGPSLVLAAAAVETRIADALDVLAEGKFSEPLWTWIRDREGDYSQEPSVAEQLDVLLEALGGRSLKEDNRLWAAGANLRRARNTFVHEGRATIGGSAVTRERARELAVHAGEIIDFIEGLLPEDRRRPRLKKEPRLEVTIPLKGSP
jgi:hypothetical protein